MRRAAKRDRSEKAIIETLRVSGWSVLQLSMANGPDLLAAKHGQAVLIECKTGTAKVKPGQCAWHASWRGCPVVILRSVEDAAQLYKALGR